ncbi:MAG: hypothetical protein DMF08_04055, partial [Verrucomicrobia bacterium]
GHQCAPARSRNGSVEGQNAIGQAIWDSQGRQGLTDYPQIYADLRKLQKEDSPQKICVNLRNLRIQKRRVRFRPSKSAARKAK